MPFSFNNNRIFLPLVLLVSLSGIISLFFLTSPNKEALLRLEKCTTMKEVKQVVENQNNLINNDIRFANQVKDKLKSFHLTQEKIDSCLLWLPANPVNINLIIVPDLSGRINTISAQRERDRDILRNAWKSFEAYSKVKNHSKDRLIVTITDDTQANGKFEKIANKLFTDMGTVTDKRNRNYFNQYRRSKFYKNIDKLYGFGMETETVPDYASFVHEKLPALYCENTLYEQYTNKLIILTDGKNSDGLPKDSVTFMEDISLKSFEVLICEIEETRLQNKTQFNQNELISALNAIGISGDKIQYWQKEYSVNPTILAIDQFIKGE